MRILFGLLLLLMLGACDGQSRTTTTTRTTVDGVAVEATATRISQGEGHFDCEKSPTGRCHVVVFTSDCLDPRQQGDAARCATKVVDRFVLAAGQARTLHDLPVGARHCLSHDTMPVPPHCDADGK